MGLLIYARYRKLTQHATTRYARKTSNETAFRNSRARVPFVVNRRAMIHVQAHDLRPLEITARVLIPANAILQRGGYALILIPAYPPQVAPWLN